MIQDVIGLENEDEFWKNFPWQAYDAVPFFVPCAALAQQNPAVLKYATPPPGLNWRLSMSFNTSLEKKIPLLMLILPPFWIMSCFLNAGQLFRKDKK